MSTIYRTLRPGMRGKDVEAHKRAVARALGHGRLRTLVAQPAVTRQLFGPFFTRNVKLVQKQAGIPQTGLIGPSTHEWLLAGGWFDAKALALYDAYVEEHMKPELVMPRQGWGSLHPSLREAYTIGRSFPYEFTDLGTYNPASRLPSGAPSDHAVYPALAFDLGISPQTGWNNLKARDYALKMAGRPEVNYVICGDRIWSRAYGWHAYRGGGHQNHVHVSGRR